MPASSSAPGPGRGILIAGVLVLLAVAALVAGVALTRVDAGFLRARMEAAAFHATGRRLTLAGPIHLILWPSPGFAAADVTLANIDGGSRPAMAHASEVQATLDLAALLRQRLIVRSLVLQNPDILVERSADGHPNWVFTPPAAPAPARAPGQTLPAPAPSAHVKLTISSVDMEGGRLAWHDLPRLGDGDVAVDHLTAQQQGKASSFTLFLAGRHASAPFTLSLAAGPPQGLAAADAAHPFPLRALLTLGSGDRDDDAPDQLGIDGQFADPLHGRGFAGAVHARLRALADLEGLFPHAGLPAAAAVRLAARVAEADAGDWTLSELHVEAGTADAGRLLPGLAVAHLKLDAASATAPIVLHAAGTLHGQNVAVDAPAAGSLHVWTGIGSPGAPIDLVVRAGQAQASLHGVTLHGADGSRTLGSAARIVVPDPAALATLFGRTTSRHVAIEADIHLALGRTATGEVTGILDTDRLLLDRAAMPPSRVTFDRHPEGALGVTVAEEKAAPWLTWNGDVSREPVDYTVILNGHRISASLVLALAGAGGGINGPLDLTGHLHGTAPGGRIDLAHLDGLLEATLVDGTISGAFLAPALRATHLPLGGAERVRCAGFSGEVASGVVTLASLSLDSRLVAIDGDGTVDLPAGTLALHLRPVVRLGVAAASAPVLVSGPIAAPEASLAHDAHGRVALSFGSRAPAGAACDANPDVAALPAPKAPKPADILRSLGLFR